MTSLLGHTTTLRELTALARSGRTGCGLLLSGGEGIGKRTLANYWIAGQLCEGRENGGDILTPCGACARCVQLVHGTSPSLYLLEPSEAGTFSIGIQKIREAKAWAALAPIYDTRYGAHKFLLIDDAHTLQKPAANALLKLLEEPPPSLFIVLVTAQPSRLPITIRSRLLSFRCTPPHWDEALQQFLLKQLPQADPQVLQTWFRIWRGGIGHLLRLPIAQWEALRVQLFETLILQRGSVTPAMLAATVDALKQVKAEIGIAMDLMLGFLRDAAWSRASAVATAAASSPDALLPLIHTDLFSKLPAAQVARSGSATDIALFLSTRRAYREVLHFELFWEDFFYRWNVGIRVQ